MKAAKRSIKGLREMQAAPLDVKIAMTKRRIREWINEWGTDGVYVSFSGGKDSTVLLHIVREMEAEAAAAAREIGLEPRAPIPAVFVNTGLEYPEVQRFAMSQPHVVTVRPKMSFPEVVKKYGYPIVGKKQARFIRDLQNASEKNKATVNLRLTGMNRVGKFVKSMKLATKWLFLKDAPFKVSEQCCDEMKKKPFKEYQKKTGRVPIIATMAAESDLRTKDWMTNGCNAFSKKQPKSAPMSFWTEQDVLLYLKQYDVPYCSVYGDIVSTDEDGNLYDILPDYLELWGEIGEMPTLTTTGCKRTGCIFCCFGCHLEEAPNRFQRLARTHPRQYNYCINGGEYVDGKWQPSKDGLGTGKVLDFIGVDYKPLPQQNE